MLRGRAGLQNPRPGLVGVRVAVCCRRRARQHLHGLGLKASLSAGLGHDLFCGLGHNPNSAMELGYVPRRSCPRLSSLQFTSPGQVQVRRRRQKLQDMMDGDTSTERREELVADVSPTEASGLRCDSPWLYGTLRHFPKSRAGLFFWRKPESRNPNDETETNDESGDGASGPFVTWCLGGKTPVPHCLTGAAAANDE